MAPAGFAIAADDVAAEKEQKNLGFRVPEGFEVALYADDDLAHDIYSMTIDAHGRVVVAGAGYVKILHDDDGDGRADRATLFSDRPKSGAHGMYFDGDDLICTGDDALMKLRDTDGDGVADGEPEIWSRLRNPEHGANGIVKGPDGWFYVACGNDAGVSEKHASTPYSPVKKPECGAIVRFSPDGKKSEIFAHGFRNPYDLDFNEHGHLFTVDADGERDQYLPWYAPCRLFDVAQGMHHGWVLKGWSRSWNRPAYFFDSVERLVEIGRGSPTGLVVYRHRQFPKHYRGGVLSACWTLGRVYYFPLTPKGSSYESKTEIFMETTGQIGFAPVDLAVGPEGNLFVAIGGRGTRGSVFRVRYAKAKAVEAAKDEDALLRVLDADQPLASWSRAKWGPVSKKLGRDSFNKRVAQLPDEKEVSGTIRAVQVLTELFDGVGDSAVSQIENSVHHRALSAALWSIGRDADPERRKARFIADGGKDDPDALAAPWYGRFDRRSVLLLCSDSRFPLLKRSAAESGQQWLAFYEDAEEKLALPSTYPERRSRDASLLAMQRYLDRLSAAEADAALSSTWNFSRGSFYELPKLPPELHSDGVRRFVGVLRIKISLSDVTKNDLVDPLCDVLSFAREEDMQAEILRAMQIACGDMRTSEQQPDFYAGYAPIKDAVLGRGTHRRLTSLLLSQFPGESRIENYEIARLLGMLAPDDASAVFKTLLCISSKSSPADDIHFLIVASRLPGERDAATTALTSVALVDLHYKMAARKWEPSRNWPLVVGELFDELCKRDAALADALVARAQFGLPEHSLFAARMKGETKLAAARKLLAFTEKADDDVRWTSEMVDVVAELPAEEVLPAVRERFDEDFGLRDSIALVLAKNPAGEDRGRLVASLASAQANVVRAAAVALAKLSAPGSADEIGAALATLRSYAADERGDRKQFAAVRQALGGLARHWSGEKIEIDESAAAKSLVEVYRPWFEWFERAHPEAAKKLAQSPGVDAAAWAKRLAAIDWNAGDATRGRAVFERRSCHRCHGATGRLGPDLAGAASRFSREDLLAAIYDPNRDVSPLYQTTQLTARGGQTYFGLLVYESPEGTLLQTGPDTTIRVTDEDYGARRASRMSLMPTGLLDGVADGEIADLYEHLRSLDGRRRD
ncbi:MAG: PVC-type heme-binding CxxCH protein [Pirellulales bacterium]